LPGVPPVAASYPGFEAWAWQGLAAPAGTPDAVQAKLRDAYHAAINDPVVRQKIIESGIEPLESTGAQMEAYMRAETAKWGKLAKDAKIALD
jgi:tripartite-type tricarboxylate transporter receptor subunit TctC